GQEGADEKTRPLDRFLRIEPVIEQVGENLYVEHRLPVAAHRRQGVHRTLVARDDGGDQRVERPLARRQHAGMRRLELEMAATILEQDAAAGDDNARAEAVEQALDDAGDVAVAIRDDEPGRVALRLTRGIRLRLAGVERRAAP